MEHGRLLQALGPHELVHLDAAFAPLAAAIRFDVEDRLQSTKNIAHATDLLTDVRRDARVAEGVPGDGLHDGGPIRWELTCARNRYRL